jgi:hypothetical protein
MAGGGTAMQSFADAAQSWTGSSAAVKQKVQRSRGAQEGVQQEAKTPQQIVQDRMSDILTTAAEARKYSMALKAHEFGETLQTQMKEHADALEKIYETVQGLVKQKAGVLKFEPHFQAAADRQEWYSTRQNVAKQMLSALKNNMKAKARGKAKAKAKQ